MAPYARKPVQAIVESTMNDETAANSFSYDDPTEAFSSGGKALWVRLLEQDVTLQNPMNPLRMIAIEACRQQDRCDRLEVFIHECPVVIDNGKGQPVTHPAWVESRQQSTNLKQLIAALRMPDQATGKRPQAHTGPIAGRTPNVMSARDRLKVI